MAMRPTLAHLLRDAFLRGEDVRTVPFARQHKVTRSAVLKALAAFDGIVALEGRGATAAWVCNNIPAMLAMTTPSTAADQVKARAWRDARAERVRCGAFADLSAAWGIAAAPIDIPLPSTRHSGLSENR